MYKSLLVITICFILIISFQSLNAETTSTNNNIGVHPGKTIYDTYCLTCHQADGYGVPGLNPPIVKTDWVLGDKNRLINVVLKGLNTPININGQTFRNPMPAHAFLTDIEIANVLSYIRSNFGNKASTVSAEEVKLVRAAK